MNHWITFWHEMPFRLNAISLFGIMLLLGLIGGELAAHLKIVPKITGYILIGFIVGPGGLNILDQSLLANSRIFIDISLGLILFDLGRHLDFAWLWYDTGLFLTAISESMLTFIFIFLIVYFYVGLPWLPSALAATISIATSAAVIMMVKYDLSAEGPVTRRTLMLTSFNNLIAVSVFTVLLGVTQSRGASSHLLLQKILYTMAGSIILGVTVFIFIKLTAYLIGKHRSNQFVMFVGAVVVTIGLAHTFSLSTMLSLLVLGISARNLDRSHQLIEVDFGWIARVFFIFLFVVTGAYLKLQGLWSAPLVVVMILLARLLAKFMGIFLFAQVSRLTWQQGVALSATLMPMAGVALGMSNMLVEFKLEFSRELVTIITAVLAVLNIIGPILVQTAFIKTGESGVERGENI